ncbi:MAG: DNA/RNA-binding winged helix domain-containing protein [Dehalococcoidia bacterium]
MVVDTRARRHRRFDERTLGALTTLARGSPEEAIFTLIGRLEPVQLSSLAKQTESGQAETRAAVDTLVGGGRVVALGAGELQPTTLLYTAPGFERLWERARAALDAYFRDHPLRSGMPKEELKMPAWDCRRAPSPTCWGDGWRTVRWRSPARW